MKKLIIKLVIKVFVIALIVSIISMLSQSPVITNEMALGQMETSNEGFIAWELFKTIKPYIRMSLTIVTGLTVHWVFNDIKVYAIQKELEKAFNTKNKES